MLVQQDLLDNFSNVVLIGDGFVRCRDVIPKYSINYYVKFAEAAGAGNDILLVSENETDDEFALLLISSVPKEYIEDELLMVNLGGESI